MLSITERHLGVCDLAVSPCCCAGENIAMAWEWFAPTCQRLAVKRRELVELDFSAADFGPEMDAVEGDHILAAAVLPDVARVAPLRGAVDPDRCGAQDR